MHCIMNLKLGLTLGSDPESPEVSVHSKAVVRVDIGFHIRIVEWPLLEPLFRIHVN